jgi:ATP-binding cassette subfamily C (CFTR/MRP) protein 5
MNFRNFNYYFKGGLSSLTTLLRTKVVSITDKRVTLMNEIIGSMKLIKMYAWEKAFQSRVLELRQQERQRLQKAAMLHSVSTAITPTVTILAAIVTLIALT